MLTQIFIISPKQTRAHKPLKLSKSDRPTRYADLSESTSTTLANEQTISSSDTKILAMKTIPSVRISPPQQLHDSCFDWDDEDRRFALVSAPTIELPGGQSTLNLNHHTMTVSAKREGSLDTGELQGQILLYLAAKLGHEEIMRKLITKTSHTSSLLNTRGQTPLLCAIEAGSTLTATLLMEQDPMSLTCKDDIGSIDFINADSLKTTIDKDQFDNVSYFVSDTRRFAAITRIQIDVNGRTYNVFEYSIALKKTEFVRTFISVRIPGDERGLYRSYKKILKHYNFGYSGSSYDQTPIQRMLTVWYAEMIPWVPLLLEQFVGEDGVDLSVVDDCLRARLAAHRSNHAPVYDQDIVKICVDLKFQLFGNFLYLLILFAQISFVCLYTGVALISPTPPHSYYD
ncbi:unnamed protein product [Rotaria magnacalcarata]|uniref:Uncharacterized protein n=3 Tax=Rotaria magnacalcarata TaxID=392030 RepID=A0A8S2K5U9_9BILA|nr:unnamed protein product [Rotaria magnacalcarata]CAF3837911.1 unnamed protein product [Rotaria magnacalcarata]